VARDVPGVVRMCLEDALRGADVVIAALPLTSATRGLIGAQALSLLPPHALLVNIGRGSVIREADVLAALEAGRLGGYAADGFEREAIGLEAAANIVDVLQGRRPRGAVNEPRVTATA